MPKCSPILLGVLIPCYGVAHVAASDARSSPQGAALCVVTEQSCLAVGGLSVRIELTPGEEPILGGQFSVLYDPAVLEFAGIAPGHECNPASPFELEISRSVDAVAGEIFYTVVVDPFGWDPEAPQGPTTMACLNFEVVASPLSSDVCLFDGVHPASTKLVGGSGGNVPVVNSSICPPDAGSAYLSCATVEVDESCVCVGGTADCSALDTDCTLGVCNETTGQCEPWTVNESAPCDDGNACTVSDVCVGGSCVGVPSGCPSLCVVADESCMALGGLSVRMELSSGDIPVVGGQFSLLYDSRALRFRGVSPGNSCDASSPFTLEIYERVDEGLGEVFYAVVVDPLKRDTIVPQTPTTLACLNFEVTGESQSDVCLFGGVNPASTMLIDGAGRQVPIYNLADCPADPGAPLLSCARVEVDETCTCVGGTADCSALDTDCIMGVCDEYNGLCESRIINNSGPCDDGDACTVSDMCVSGECVGFACRAPSLCVDAGEQCALPGDTIDVTIELGQGDRVINGGQFSIEYDPADLDFVAISPGSTCDAASPFAFEVAEIVDEVEGRIFYSAIVEPWGRPGTTGPATMACLTFVLRGATGDSICLVEGVNPFYTILIDESGNAAQIHNADDCPTSLPGPIIACDRPCEAIPTLSTWGVIIMATVLLCLGKLVFGLGRPLRAA